MLFVHLCVCFLIFLFFFWVFGILRICSVFLSICDCYLVVCCLFVCVVWGCSVSCRNRCPGLASPAPAGTAARGSGAWVITEGHGEDRCVPVTCAAGVEQLLFELHPLTRTFTSDEEKKAHGIDASRFFDWTVCRALQRDAGDTLVTPEGPDSSTRPPPRPSPPPPPSGKQNQA